MSVDAKIVDFTAAKTKREVLGGMHEMLQANLRSAIASIAVIHGGMPDEWIDRKAQVCVTIMADMLSALDNPVPIPLPEALTDQEQAAVLAAVGSWVRQQNHICQNAFALRLVELLGP